MGGLDRILDSIKRRIFLLIGRSIVTYVNNNDMIQKIQMDALSNETITDVERIQEYGLETYPWAMRRKENDKLQYEGTDTNNLAQVEAVSIFQNGDRGRGLVLIIGDRYYRLTDLSQGEVALYTFKDKDSGNHRIHLKNDRSIEIKAASVTVNCNITISNGSLSASSDISDSKGSMDEMRDTYNLHSHGNDGADPPSPQMT